MKQIALTVIALSLACAKPALAQNAEFVITRAGARPVAGDSAQPSFGRGRGFRAAIAAS